MDTTKKKIKKILAEYNNPKQSLNCILEDIQMEFGAVTGDAIKEIAEKLELSILAVTTAVEKCSGLVLDRDIRIPVEICSCPACKLHGGQDLARGLGSILLIKSCAGNIGSKYYISEYPESSSPCVHPPTVRIEGRVYREMNLSKLLALLESDILKKKSVYTPKVASF